MNKDLCNDKTCTNYERFARYCGHYQISPLKPKAIKPYSEKRQKINRKEYGPAAAKYVKDHPTCEMNLKGCTIKAVCVHHEKGRSTIKDLLNQEFWKSACVNCNNRAESHTKEAQEAGVRKSKHEPNYKRTA